MHADSLHQRPVSTKIHTHCKFITQCVYTDGEQNSCKMTVSCTVYKSVNFLLKVFENFCVDVTVGNTTCELALFDTAGSLAS